MRFVAYREDKAFKAVSCHHATPEWAATPDEVATPEGVNPLMRLQPLRGCNP